MLPTDKQARKERPVASGVLDYFPDAIAEVAHVSFVGNQQHNPGQPMHWARNKSTDHADCVARHLLEKGTVDVDGVRHTAKLAWRALAMLQLELEQTSFPPKLAEPPIPVEAFSQPDADAEKLNAYLIAQDEARHQRFVNVGGYSNRVDFDVDFVVSADQTDYEFLVDKGCNPTVANSIVEGTTYQNDPAAPYVYISGPMRGKPEFNFPAFDAERDVYAHNGYNVISPADIDRAAGDTDSATGKHAEAVDYVYRDFYALLLIQHHNGYIHMMDGHEKSTGATAELAVAKWMGIGTRGVGQ